MSGKSEKNLYFKRVLLATGIGRNIQLTVHQLPQFLARFEKGHPFGGNIHPITRLRVPPDTCVSASDSKTAKPSQFNLFSLRQRLGNTLKDSIDHNLRLLFGQVDLSRNLFHQFRFGHLNESPPKSLGEYIINLKQVKRFEGLRWKIYGLFG